MIDLKKYVVGVKPKDREELVLRNDALEKNEEHMMVLLIPESEYDEMIVELLGEN